jgi:hypothetical protein
MTDRERIEQALAREGLTADDWKDDPDDGLTAVIGRYRCVDDDERSYAFSEDEGVMSASVVGAEQYHNQRVAFAFLADGTDAAMEIAGFEYYEPID